MVLLQQTEGHEKQAEEEEQEVTVEEHPKGRQQPTIFSSSSVLPLTLDVLPESFQQVLVRQGDHCPEEAGVFKGKVRWGDEHDRCGEMFVI